MLTHDVPKLHRYEHALEHFNNTKPIRGKDVRPLGGRRYYHDRWMKMLDDETIRIGTYVDKPVVDYHKDGSITFYYGGYDLANRQILAPLFRDLLKVRYAHSDKFYLYDMTKHVQYALHRSEKPSLTLTLQDGALTGDVVCEKKAYIIRSKMKEKREMFADFLEYAKGMLKLSGMFMSMDDLHKSRTTMVWKSGAFAEYMRAVEGKKFDEAIEEFGNAYQACIYHSISYRRKRLYNWRTHGYHFTGDEIRLCVDDYIKDNHEDVFEMREVPNTTIVR